MKKTKRRILSIILALVMVLGVIPFAGMTAFAAPVTLTDFSGEGTADKPYEIATKAQLAKLAEIVNGGTDCADTYFVLTDNIGSTENPVTTVIGNTDKRFVGSIDGKGFTVTMNIISKNNEEVINELKQLGVSGEEFYLENLVSEMDVLYALDDYIADGKISLGSASKEQVVEILNQLPKEFVGFCGSLDVGGVIKNVTVAGSVEGSWWVGGVCADCWGTIINCCNTCEVSGKEYVGGICGFAGLCKITNCYNTANVSGKEYVGGVCGQNVGSITNCYNIGKVPDSGDSIGGVCGFNNGTLTNCYFNKDVCNGNLCGVGRVATKNYGLSTVQMQAASGSKTLTTGIADNKPLVDLLNEYVKNARTADLENWTNKQGEYPVFGTPTPHTDVTKIESISTRYGEPATYSLVITGRAIKIQFVDEKGNTWTFSRDGAALQNNKNLGIVSCDKDGNVVDDDARSLDHEVWNVTALLPEGNYKVIAKYSGIGWQKESAFDFAVVYSVENTNYISADYATSGPAGRVTVKITTESNVQKVQLTMNGTTNTSANSVVNPDGTKTFTLTAFTVKGANKIKVNIKYNNKWMNDVDVLTYTAE
ncbi:MAG: hypothetical protein KBT46_02445 [Ruminococcus sp.]|nr:hypothetical protein [Candidatus Copronaster equi]